MGKIKELEAVMFRCAIITDAGRTASLNGTRDEIDAWLLNIMEAEGVKLYRIINIETKEIIETEKGKK
jgi:hypothetical protein